MEIYVKNILWFPYFILSCGFNRDFVIYIDITHVAASNRTTDDVTN